MTHLYSRRTWLQHAAVSIGGFSASGWLAALAAASTASQQPPKAMILLWLNGGPATIDLWDPKPNHENGGPLEEIDTAVPGLRIAENLPRLANEARDLTLIRSLTSREGDHGRAAYFVRTGYKPMGGIDFADLGAVVAHELAAPEAELPSFISIAPPRRTRFAGSGYLGPQYAPLAIGETAVSAADLRVENLTSAASLPAENQSLRQRLLTEFDRSFQRRRQGPLVDRYRTATQRALRMMRPEVAAAFDLEQERDSVRAQYGPGLFGQGCLLARRLVERGVPFVEVTLDGWDTHQNNFPRVQGLSAQLDAGFAGLIADLRQRGMLESTLILCLGEFGRTPHINSNAGRDHWPNAWAAALAGGGTRGGQIIGGTSHDGREVVGEEHTVPDLIATCCEALGIDPRKQNDSNVGRPIRIADPAARAIAGVL